MVDSTNSELARMIQMNNTLIEGEVIVASDQTSGKGLGENAWESEAGKNLTFSIFLTPNFLRADQQFYLNMAIALGIYDYVKSVASNEFVKIKWPNDIYIENKKVAGILINHAISGQNILNTIAGIGININQKQFLSDAPNPISLFQLLGNELDLKKSLFDLLEKINSRYYNLSLGNFSLLKSNYIDALFGYYKWLKFKQDKHRILARITGVSELGLLQLETSDMKTFECDLKEIEFVV